MSASLSGGEIDCLCAFRMALSPPARLWLPLVFISLLVFLVRSLATMVPPQAETSLNKCRILDRCIKALEVAPQGQGQALVGFDSVS